MAGTGPCVDVDPKVKSAQDGFGSVFARSLPSTFYRQAEALPPDMRYFDGKRTRGHDLGSAWQGANFRAHRQNDRNLPGITLIGRVGHSGTRELKELSLAVDTPDGLCWWSSCSAPGIDKIVEAAGNHQSPDPLIAGGFSLALSRRMTPSRSRGDARGYFRSREHRARSLYWSADVCGIKASLRRSLRVCRLRLRRSRPDRVPAPAKTWRSTGTRCRGSCRLSQLAARGPVRLATWRRKLANETSDGAKQR